jgi:hypothetical protein
MKHSAREEKIKNLLEDINLFSLSPSHTDMWYAALIDDSPFAIWQIIALRLKLLQLNFIYTLSLQY